MPRLNFPIWNINHDNDEFVFNNGLNNPGSFRPGLFVNNGNIEMQNVEIYQLEE
ncbi:MAG: hypothetical protein LBB85_12515 [Dysgonamonadaceae bacterium]|nr:hypothetical protein [Dysgonamonadaceae bacterium]